MTIMSHEGKCNFAWTRYKIVLLGLLANEMFLHCSFLENYSSAPLFRESTSQQLRVAWRNYEDFIS